MNASDYFVNDACKGTAIGPVPTAAPRAFHRRLPGFVPTPLHRLPDLARSLGVCEVLVKDESARLGLPAFKILGGAWGAYRALEERSGRAFERDASLDEIRTKIRALGPLTLATATAGNHGRGVARIARLLGLEAHITVPEGTRAAPIDALRSEGARVTVYPGDYDEAFEHVARTVDERTLLIQDNATSGESAMVRWIVAGYGTIFHEVSEQLVEGSIPSPDLVVLPVGAAALASAGLAHFRSNGMPSFDPVKILGVEPVDAACGLAALRAGAVVLVPGPHGSIMAGMNCGRIAAPAWPYLRDGMNAIVTIDDDACRAAMATLAAHDVTSGACGAAGLAGVQQVLEPDGGHPLRKALELGDSSTVLLLVTEGPTSG